eukprot:TRINITY_DN10118_c0_g1_i2.p1 TRINITY_DN10118_c0_g1~~TRINITY_DN10118_c0_g1_i2.p1  ORF type:complete len:617 (-),score=211.83 TRINITY_DN10118_c0_g1_i2:633-2483(-)
MEQLPTPLTANSGSSLSITDFEQEKKLFEAVLASDASKVVELLEDEALDVDWVNADEAGRTALHAATEAGNTLIVAMLLGNGADVCLRDIQGRTPLHIALESENSDMLQLLANKALATLERLKSRAQTAVAVNSADEFEQLMTRRFLQEYARLYARRPEAASPRTPATSQAVAMNGHGGKQQEKAAPSTSTPRPPTPTSPFQTFFPRKSIITELLTISHFQTIYNVFVAVFLISLINTLVYNFYDSGQPLDFTLLIWSFTGWHHAAWMWLAIMTLSCSAYILQRFIVVELVSPTVCYYIYAVTLAVMHAATVKLVWFYELRIAAATTVMCELTRLTMKMHSYLMVNRLLRQAKAAGAEDPEVKRYPHNVNFRNYFEYLWMPCLVYQTSYPRNSKIDWWFATRSIVEAFMCIFYIYAVFDRYCVPYLHEMVGSYGALSLGIFKLMLPGIALSMLAFYLLLHSWMNAFAEVTRFADRRFYSDWWNARSWSAYYRKWNIVVHNFIHRHIFMECLVTWRLGRNGAMWFTFIFSAIIHEYIIAVALGFYKPVLFIMFVVPGVLFIYLTKFMKESHFWNIFMWAMLIIGHGMLIGLYRRAWHFRYIVPGHSDDSWLSLIWIL